MSALRLLVQFASLVQIGAGSCVAYQLMLPGRTDVLGLLLCSLVVVAGLASLASLCIGGRPSVSRKATIRLNLLVLIVLVGIGGLLIVAGYRKGMERCDLEFLGVLFAACATPFVINGIALCLIERRARRLA